jgi:ankyrin repeat protein
MLPNDSYQTTPVCFAAMAVFSVMISATLTGCTCWNTDQGQAARDKMFADASVKQRANLEARRAAADLQRARDQAASDARANALPPLLEAARFADFKQVKTVLAGGADRKMLNAALLLMSRSEPLLVGHNGEEVKDASLPYVATARLLLEKGASLHARDEDGSLPLLLAAAYGETAVVKLFLDREAKVESTNSLGQTALIAAACNCRIIHMPDTAGIVRLLLENGANVEAKDKHGETPLMAAADRGRTPIVQILLEKGARIEARDKEGNTALLISAQGGGYPTAEVVYLLLDKGADIKARNNKGETALMLAASYGGFEDAKIVKMLLKRGAGVSAKDLRGRTAIDMAVSAGRTEISSLLSAAIAKSH